MTSALESFLTLSVAKGYTRSRYGARWLWTETYGDGTKLSAQLGTDMLRYDDLRRELIAALGVEPSARAAIAEKWVFFLKPRIERLDFWASFLSATAALVVAAAGLASLGSALAGKNVTYEYVVIGSFIAILVSFFRFEIEQKKLWYKYVATHLEAIKSELSKREA